MTTFYDPMIAKLVVWGEDRAVTLKKLKDTLSQYQVRSHAVKPLIKDSPKEDNPPNKGQAESTLVYILCT